MACWGIRQCLMVAGLFLIMLMELGILKAFSVFAVDIMYDLQISMSFFGMVIGLCHALSIALGIFHIPLLRRFSYRQLISTGGAVSSICYTAISFTKSDVQLAMCFIMASFGNAVVVMPSHTAASVFFPETFEIVTGIVFAGCGIGMMTMPIVADILNDAYGWRGATMILGACAFHTTLGGAILRPLPNAEHCSREFSLNTNEETVPLTLADEKAFSTDRKITKEREIKRTNIFKRIATYFDLVIVRDHPIVLIGLVLYFLYFFINVTWYVFVVPNAVAKGIPQQAAVVVAVLGGIGNTIGRLIIGIISSFKFVGDDILLCALNILSAGAFLCNIVSSTLARLSAIALVTGFCLGCISTLLSIFLRSMVPVERFPAAITLACLLPAFGEAFGGALMGHLYDVTSSFDLSYIIVGVMHLVFIVFAMIPRIANKLGL